MQDATDIESTPVRIAQAHQFYGSEVSDTSSKQAPRGSASWLLYIALGLFAIGLLAVFAIFGVHLLSDAKPGVWLYLLAMCAPLGFLLSVVYALWSGRRSR